MLFTSTSKSSQKLSLLEIYQCVLAVCAVFVFFTYLDLYLPETGISSISPLQIVFLFCLAASPLVLTLPDKLKFLPFPIIFWSVGYVTIGITSLFFFIISEGQYHVLELRILTAIFINCMVLIFVGNSQAHTWTRRAIFIAILIALINVIYQLFNPTAFKVESFTMAIRPAGLYVDSNKTGCALVLGMILTIGLLKPAYRIYYILLIGLFNLITFSRGAILCWAVISWMLIRARLVPRKHLIYSAIALGIGAFILSLIWATLLSDLQHLQSVNPYYRVMLERLDWFDRPSSVSADDSSSSRLEVIMLALQMFVRSPIWGNGVGSTTDFSVGINTHNMYVAFLADYGIWGALIMPWLAYTMICNAKGENKYISHCAAVMILIWSMFSHTALEDRFIIIVPPLVAAMNQIPQPQPKKALLPDRIS